LQRLSSAYGKKQNSAFANDRLLASLKIMAIIENRDLHVSKLAPGRFIYKAGLIHPIGLVSVEERWYSIVAKVTPTDFYNGMVIRYNNVLYSIQKIDHITPGNWRAFYQVRLKNLKNGRILEQRFNASEEVEAVRVEHQNWQFLYVDGDDYIFMNTETYDQQPVARELLGDGVKFLKEGDVVEMLVEGETILAVELPNFLELTVESAEPGVRGDTATNVTKPATLETGATINVPLFINPGDRIRIDTRTGKYVERVK
jgi:elongation factor P